MQKACKFELYSRVDCHLCEQMLLDLKQFMGSTVYNIEIIDIDRKPELQSEYGGRIPVLTFDNKLMCEYFFDSQHLEEVLNQPQ